MAQAITVNAPSSLIGSGSLLGEDAYAWGVSISVPNGQTITSAQIDFTSIDLAGANSSGTGYLYTDLLKSTATPGGSVSTVSDNDNPGDYWATSGLTYTSVSSLFFPSVGTTISTNVVFNSTELAALNSYLAAGSGTFDIGIDPDCHYNVGGLALVYSLSPTNHGNSVPDMATTSLLLVMGLAGLEIFRRQLVAVKIKA